MNYIERNRDFKGVWIPKEIWLNEELTMLEKIILVEIDSLDNEEHCVAGNEYLAQFCQCSEWKVSTAIKKLQELGYVEVVSFDGRHRRLRSCLWKFHIQPLENPKSDLGKPKAINIVNNIDNNIDNIYNVETSSTAYISESSPNNFSSEKDTLTNKATPSEKEDKYSSEIKAIVDYLNEKAHTRYRASSDNTKKHIIARLKQEYTIDDFKHVIDVKCADWLNTDFEKFLRPETLFGSKFENYLNSKINKATVAKKSDDIHLTKSQPIVEQKPVTSYTSANETLAAIMSLKQINNNNIF